MEELTFIPLIDDSDVFGFMVQKGLCTPDNSEHRVTLFTTPASGVFRIKSAFARFVGGT